MFVDTHAHVSDRAFDEDREEILRVALATGMPFLVDVGCDPDSSRRAVALAEVHPRVYATCGVHPHDAATHGPEGARGVIAELAGHPKVVALGEMGLDFYYDHSPRQEQLAVFQAQLDEARKRDKPIVMHVRDAEAQALECLGQGGFPRGIWHCFTGTLPSAQAAIEGGMFVSFSGILTFKGSGELREVARSLPEDRLLVETDCPYLAPVPRRGRRNQPAYVGYTAACMAELRGRSPEAMAEVLNANARRAFDLPEAT